ncbi:MAG: EAL domain-containing protein [Rhizobacter sp.]|nr:EAL domain-containing protein [Rhizobacter sp.]
MLQAFEPDHPLAGAFRAKQLQAILRLSPLTFVANLVNAGLICVVFWSGTNQSVLLLWFVLVAGVMLQGLRAWRRGKWRPSASPRALRRAVLHASVLAMLWAMVPLWLFSGASGPELLLLSVITTGMICAGGFALATVPVAASAYVLILSAGGALGLVFADFTLALVVSLLLLCYAAIVLASVWSSASQFNARLMAEAEAERQSQVIGLLLRDFEEHTSDLLWEIDATGRLCHMSARLLAALRQPVEHLGAQPAIELLEGLQHRLPEELREYLDALRQALQLGAPFRDMMLPLPDGEQVRWWSLTAKPLNDERGQRIGWRGVAADITEAQHANSQLTFLAHYDALTGLANRHQLRAQLAELLAPRAGTQPSCALLCLDLDHFKTINDTLGHAVGDGLLQEVARRLLAGIRHSDIAGRLGGDEFVVILNDVQSSDEVAVLTRRLLDRLHQPCEVQGAALSMRISIGVAMAPQDGAQIDLLLNNADLALYAAKSQGRGDFRFFVPQMATQTRRRMQIEHGLRDALGKGELQLVYQPQISLHNWRVIGFEALLRWTHAELGEVPPSEFIPVAEDAGLILNIGDWVLREACRSACHWPEASYVSVNVSSVQAMSNDLCETIRRILEELGMPARRLELEITESVFLNESHATMHGLRALKELGLRIALDDFGTGYSSLAYLRRFPFNTLKIDRSFVRELMSRGDARAIVRSIVGLARTLNMNTVAEGVEEAQQLDVLGGYGCGAIQGHFVARPMPAERVPAFLAAWVERARPDPGNLRKTDMMPLA